MTPTTTTRARATGRLAAALAAADRGWPVFPLLPGRKTPASSMTNWEARATTDLDAILRWWLRRPVDNVAIACGPARLVVVDLDLAKDPGSPFRSGWDVLVDLADAHGQTIPDTFTVETASGGRHLYYQAPDGTALRNTARRIGPLVDTRAGGGYVVASGSVFDGRLYHLATDRPVAELPAWLTALSAPPAPAQAPLPRRSGRVAAADRYAAVALADELDRIHCAGPGRRNEALNHAAYYLARHVAVGRLTRHTVERELQAAGEANTDQGPRGVAATIRSALNAGLRRYGAAT
jgi:hypothetical protein